MAVQRPSSKSVKILEEVANVYAILHTPDEEDQEAFIQVYGRCHLETKEDLSTIQHRLSTLENASTVVPSPQSQSSSLEGIHHELSEMNDRLQDLETAVTQRLDDVEYSVSKLKDDVQELNSKIDDTGECFSMSIVKLERDMDGRFHDMDRRFDGVDQTLHDIYQRFDANDRKFDEIDRKLDAADRRFDVIDRKFDAIDRRFDVIDKKFDAIDKKFEAIDKRFEAIDMRFEAIDKRFEAIDNRFEAIDKKFDTIDRKFDTIDYRLESLRAISLNGIADRFFTKVASVGVDYLDSHGQTCFRYPHGPSQSVKYYWKMHSPKYHDKLKALHEFYLISYTDWALDEDSSDEDESLDPPSHPSSLEAAIAKYPSLAVRVLFSRLGLIYSKFEEQAEKLEALDQGSAKVAEKRESSRALPLGVPKSKIRRRNPSSGSTTELLTRSSTQSHE